MSRPIDRVDMTAADPSRGIARGFRASRLWPALGAACLLASSAADARTISFYSLGIGRTSCQKYIAASTGLEPDHFHTLLKEQRTFVSENNAYDEWIRGAVSAMNYASAESGRHPVIRPSAVEAITWMRTWCGSHPDTTVMNAVLSYFQEKWAVPAATTAAAAPPAAGTSAPPAAAAPPASAPQSAPQFVFVIFQKDIAAADMAAFLKTYRVAVDDGPNPDGFYKLRLSDPLSADQVAAMLESMRSQTKLVATAVTN